ncbi:MAG: hypothetical protein A2W85_17265 [Bacteroidetes bacterium GWF2_41_31]|nr:MAG: hypothetical protein A2W85_17265 [Bacteroidetes bacterium GWF2_41_31]
MFHFGVGRVGFSERETNKIKQEISEYLCVSLYQGLGGRLDIFIIHDRLLFHAYGRQVELRYSFQRAYLRQEISRFTYR